jgi:uncharacterized phage protein gp47/JayE
MEYGLTERGLVVKPLQQILREEREAFITAFGSDIDTSDESIAGAYIGNQAAKQAQLWEIVEGLWWAGDVDSASGVYLDRLVALVSVFRNPATKTEVYEALWGDLNTIIPAGHQIRVVPTGELFNLVNPVTIHLDKIIAFSFKVITLTGGAVYSCMVDGVTVSFSAPASPSKSDIQSGLIEALQSVFPQKYAGENNGDEGAVVYRSDGYPFALTFTDAKLKLTGQASRGIYFCTEPGAVYVPERSLVEVVNKVSGLDSAVNYSPGYTGRGAESDAELRRNLKRRQVRSSGNEVAIQNAIESVKDVEFVQVYSNRTGTVDADGIPANSYEALVVGGNDQEIAQAIFDAGPGGIQAFGNIVVTVLDKKGNQWPIGFSRPTPRYIWIKVTITQYAEEQFPADGLEQAKDQIQEWANANLSVGVDVLYQRFFIPINNVPGISTAIIQVAVTANLTAPAANAYSQNNVPISNFEIARVDKSRIQAVMG